VQVTVCQQVSECSHFLLFDLTVSRSVHTSAGVLPQLLLLASVQWQGGAPCAACFKGVQPSCVVEHPAGRHHCCHQSRMGISLVNGIDAHPCSAQLWSCCCSQQLALAGLVFLSLLDS
jgi:hypothetical protein